MLKRPYNGWVQPPRRQLEVGAGTGQLTAALVRLGPTVALEPSPPMAERLSDNLAAEIAAGRLQVGSGRSSRSTRVTGRSTTSGAAMLGTGSSLLSPILSRRALLTASGLLINTWGFPALADLGLTSALNEVYKELNPHLVREGAPRLSVEDELFADGRDEVERSGAMIVVDAWLDQRTVEVTAERYLDWQLSFAHIAYLTVDQRLRLRDAIASVLAQRRTELVEVRISQYTVASAKSPGAPP